MIDMIKTKKYTGPLKPGVIVRSTACGSQLMRIRSIEDDGIVLENYAWLAYGVLHFRNVYRTVKGELSKYDAYIHTPPRLGYGNSYEPVELESRFYDAGDAYDIGVSNMKHRIKQSIHGKVPEWFKRMLAERLFKNPFKGTELENTYWDGVESVPLINQE